MIKMGKKKIIYDVNLRDALARKLQKAVEEMVRTIPKTLKKQIPEIDWEDLKNFRNFIVHHYYNVEWETMWDVAQIKMKVVDEACKMLLKILGEEGK